LQVELFRDIKDIIEDIDMESTERNIKDMPRDMGKNIRDMENIKDMPRITERSILRDTERSILRDTE